MTDSNQIQPRVRVWDPFVRVFHWTLVGVVIANQWINEEGEWWHSFLGYVACGAIALRLIWGFVGTRYARFRAHKLPPGLTLRRSIELSLEGKHPRTLGHPPIAVIAMAAMLLLILGLGITGWMMEETDRFFGVEWVQEVHWAMANALILLAAIHVIGVLRESFLHRENLVAAMIHGKKRAESSAKIGEDA